MKRFKEQLMENPTLDAIGHDMPMSPKRKKQLEADKGVFDDFSESFWSRFGLLWGDFWTLLGHFFAFFLEV